MPGLGHFGESIVRSTFRKLDKNHNGKLEFFEALNAISVLKGLKSHGSHF